MRHHKETFLKNCQPLVTDGLNLSAAVYLHEDGRRHVYFFFDSSSDVRKIGSQNDVTRVGYRLSSSKYAEDQHVPRVNVLHDDCPPELNIDCSPASKFYEIVPPSEVTESYPLTTDAANVAIHTRYHL